MSTKGDWNPNDTGSLQRQASHRGSIGLQKLFRRPHRASFSSVATVVTDDTTVNCQRSSTLAVPITSSGRCQAERIPLTRQRSSPVTTITGSSTDIMTCTNSASARGSQSTATNAAGYGSTVAINRARSMRSGSAIESSLKPGGCDLFVGDRCGGRYLVVTDAPSPWERCRTTCSTLSVSRAGSELMLQPPTPNVSGSGDDDTDSVNQMQFGGTVSPPLSPGGASSLSVSIGTPSNDGRFRFRYNRSFTFRRGTSTSSSGGAGTGSRRSSTSPDKSRRAVQVTPRCSILSLHYGVLFQAICPGMPR